MQVSTCVLFFCPDAAFVLSSARYIRKEMLVYDFYL